jgi:cyclophilin family peptidyl-prolyl cis-trans isomerase
VVAVGRSTNLDFIRRTTTAGLKDPAPIVRFRALNVYAQKLRASDGCGPLIALTHDVDTTVALGATDALSACHDEATAARLLSMASANFGDEQWHLATHAYVSLAVADSAKARLVASRFISGRNFFVRMYADTAARLMGDVGTLYRLARDPHPNVASAAIAGLSALVGHAADSVYVATLAGYDNQLITTAATALKGSAWPGLGPIVTARYRQIRSIETYDDAQQALMQRRRELGETEILPELPPRKRIVPTFDELAALERATARIEMQNGSIVTIRLLPFDAPTNAFRFARLAKAGAFDGLTFHRVAPFFVVQGPSPNANEYSAPDTVFERDELGVSNARGTVGLSTGSRDTADGQIYINTVDNIWLDHEYTVMGVITSGLEAFDRMQEGARIRRITIQP